MVQTREMRAVDPFDDLTDEQKQRLEKFAVGMVRSVEIGMELKKKSNAEIAQLLMRVSDDYSIISPQYDVLVEAAERLGYNFEEGIKKGKFVFPRVACRECGKLVAGNWIVRHLKSRCQEG